jgi:hypothetical protein
MKITTGQSIDTSTLIDKIEKSDLEHLNQAVTTLSDKLNTHVKSHPNREEAHSQATTILSDKMSTKAKKEAAISAANATDLATAITLLNEIKTKLNSMNS